MRVRSFSHAAITVRDFRRTAQFYRDVFGCPLVGVADQPPERVRAFFGVDAPAPTCKVGWIRAPGGAVIEIFEFQPQEPAARGPWNQVGMTHIAFNVRGAQRWYDYLVSKGVECLSPPEKSPRGHSFFFARDCDGNLIEIMDLGYKYAVLKWLGGLAGRVVTLYKQYYTPVAPPASADGTRPPGR